MSGRRGEGQRLRLEIRPEASPQEAEAIERALAEMRIAEEHLAAADPALARPSRPRAGSSSPTPEA